MSFPPAFLDEIRNRIRLSDVVGRRVQLRHRGRDDWWGLSPFTNEKTPSFHVRDDKDYFHCFSTGEHGDHFTWLMKAEGLGFPEAVERLAGEAGLEMPQRSPEQRQADDRRTSLLEVTEAACRWFQKQLRAAAGRPALDYLRGRGVSDAAIAEFRLGFAPADGSAFKAAMQADGVPEDALVETGLMRRGDDGRPAYVFFRDRVMFPISDRGGRIVAFGGRFMGDAKAAGIGKYVNSPDTPLFDKSRTIYNLGPARRAAHDGAALILAEGYMDVIALSEAGFAGAVAPLGTAVTEAQLELLWRAVDEPVLCLDGDEAGRRAALRAADRALPLLRPGKSLRFAFLPPGEDPDTLVRGRGATAMQSILDAAEPLDAVLWNAEAAGQPLDTPERRAALEARLMQLAGRIGDEAVRRQYRSRFRDRLWQTFRPNRTGGGRAGARIDRIHGSAARATAPAIARLRPTLPRRQQQLVLAILVNHPELLPEFMEPLAGFTFDGDLDKLHQGLQNLVAFSGDLDLDAVRHHFASVGADSLLNLVLDKRLYALARQAHPDAPVEDARAALRHMLDIRTQDTLQRELASMARTSDEGGEPAREARVLAFRQSYEEGERNLTGPDDGLT